MYVCMYIGDEVIEDTSPDKGSYEAYYRVYTHTHSISINSILLHIVCIYAQNIVYLYKYLLL
jgi:hypothetical protein